MEEGRAEDWDTAAEAEVPPELEAFQVLADADELFDSHWVDWMDFRLRIRNPAAAGAELPGRDPASDR